MGHIYDGQLSLQKYLTDEPPQHHIVYEHMHV